MSKPLPYITVKQDGDNGLNLDAADGLTAAVIVGCTPEAQDLIAAAPVMLQTLAEIHGRLYTLLCSRELDSTGKAFHEVRKLRDRISITINSANLSDHLKP